MNSSLSSCKGFAFRHLSKTAVSIFSTIFLNAAYVEATLANTDIDSENVSSVFSAGSINPLWDHGLHSYLAYAQADTGQPKVRVCETPLSANQADVQENTSVNPLFEYSSDASCGVSELSGEAGQLFKFTSATQLTDDQGFNPYVFETGMSITVQDSLDFSAFSNGVLRLEVLGSPSQSTNILISLNDNVGEDEFGNNGNHLSLLYTLESEIEYRVIEIDLESWLSENINFDIAQVDAISLTNFGELTLKSIEFVQQTQESSDGDGGNEVSDGGNGNDVRASAVEMVEGFGGAIFDQATSSYTFPAGSEVWAGFANLNTDIYPFTFANGGSISFTAALPAGGTDTSVYFRFERRPYPDSDPSFNLDPVVISGSEQEYTVTVPAQDAENTYESFLMYLVEQDSPVIIKNIVVTDNAEPDSDGSDSGTPASAAGYKAIPFGAGSVSDTINSASYRCVVDYGNWIYNAGVVEPGIDGCDGSSGVPSGTPTPLLPQITGEALNRPIPTHKWWGSVPFVGEMTVGDSSKAAYITPDPIRARISNTGARVSGIPSSFKSLGNFPRYDGPAPFDEVFEGVAIANSVFSDMDAFLKDHSDGSVTVQWKSGTTEVMDATFVHGSPYVYFKIHQGNALLRTLREDGGEKGTFYNQGNHLGIWTNIAGIRNNILLSGEGITTYSNISSNEITINNDSNEFTLTYLPELSGNVSDSMTSDFAAKARNKVASVEIGYTVDRSTNTVTVNHAYLDAQGNAADTIVGMHPLHWKNSDQATSAYKVRSARGMIKFATTDGFSYDLPFTGVLPTMPSISGSFDQATLEALVTSFVNAGESEWYNSTDTYWSGKGYGKVAETAALAQSIGMEDAAAELIAWLKVELADWFTAETDGELDINKYFVYDETWDALLGIEEAYGSHQRMADHHFHYGYFVRAAAEICRVDVAWCGDDQYGPMIELLIRDYAGDDSEEMFPKMRNFDPANGFSWADGKGDTIQGNNNESTSEAANAYGAMVLYGLAVGNDAIVEKGMYMHASTSAAFWQYWNNIDGYNNLGADYDNFAPGYDKITTSIIWGSGADFSTWFSPAYAHILGIQGLPSNPLILYVGQYADYMESYVELGMTESSNGNPSGLAGDQWTDLWWNLWAMTDADAALADYNSVGTNYDAEAGESKAHTYHWLHTFKALGHLKTGTGELTANDASALAFDKDGLRTYVVYNFTDQSKAVTYSDGRIVNALANSFTIKTSDDPQGSLDSDSDGGATDGSTDGGTTDGGADGSDAEVSDIIDMTGSFGRAELQGSSYSFPTGSEVWAGFANVNTNVYPFTFANGGSISFTAAVPAGGNDTNVYFRFERLPFPDIEPSFNLAPVLIAGETEMEYTVTIPAQNAANTYASFLLYIVEQDQTVIIRDIVVTDDSGSTDSAGGETTGGGSNDADPVISTVTVFDDGVVGSAWDGDIVAWDAFLAGTCMNDGGAGCPSIDWTLVSDNERGDVLQVSHSEEGHFASLIFSSHLSPQDLSAFSQGSLIFDIKVLSGDSNISIEVLCVLPCRTSVIPIESNDLTDWETVSIPVERLVAEGLDLRSVDTGLIIFATNYTGTVFQLDNIRWEQSSNGGSTDGGNADDDASDGGSTDGGSTDGGFSSPPLNIFSDGAVDPFWDSGINGYDSSIDWQECNNDGGQACPNIDWQIVSDDYRGDVLMVSHTGNQVSTGLYIGASSVQDLSAYAGGYFIYDIKIVAAGDNSLVSSRVNCWYPCTSGSMGVGTLEGDWKTEKIPVDFLVETGLDLSAVSSLVFDLTDDGDQNVVILLDKIRFEAANDDGSTDGGTTNGFTDGGTTDVGSVDGGANERASIEMIEGFGGAVFDEASSSYIFPTGSEVWAGFANLNVDVYPFTFANGGSITFTAAVAAGGSDTSIYFRFERLPHPDVEPSFNLDPVSIVGETEMEYTVIIPAQNAANTYESFLLHVVEQDQTVIIKDIVVTDDTGSTGDGAGSADGGTTDGGFGSPPLNIFSDGAVDPFWDSGINGYDSSIGWYECNNDGGQACPSIDWQIVSDDYRGDVLMVSHTGNQVSTGLYIGASSVQDLSAYAGGYFIYDIKIVTAGDNSRVSSRVHCWYPCTSGSMGVGTLEGDWKTEKIPVDFLVETGLDLSAVSSFVFDLTDDGDESIVILLDKIRFEAANDDGSTDGDGSSDGGSTDGSTDGGSTDGGSTDGGSTDGGTQDGSFVQMIEGFGGAFVDGNTFIYPSGAEDWAGFANLNTDIFPFTFDNGGSVSFTAAVAAGGADTNIYFRFERLPFPDVDPSFNLDPVTISGETELEYTITIPAQTGGNTYESLLMYVVEQDSPVIIKNIIVNDDGGATGGTTDGGTTDGGTTDGGTTDGGTTDGGTTDGGTTDGGTTDGGSTDGGSSDGGSSEPTLPAQSINLAGTPMAMMGNSLQLRFNYNVDNNDNTLPGLGLRVHFDSSVLSFAGATALIDKDLMFAGSDALFDVDDYDNNLDTDSYVDFAWASIGGDWPSEILPVALIDMSFDVTIETIKQVTPIGFSYSSLPSGYRLIAEEYSLPVISGGWDIDRNGQADPLTDGMLFMRYAFGLRGYNLIDGVVAPDASIVSEGEIEASLAYAFDFIGDIDGNGSVDALTDGLLLTRYLFGFTGDALIDAIVAEDATRTSAADIEAYIQSMMPNQ